MARRWIRLDVSWEDSVWLDALSGAAAGCWPRLLCTVKRDGSGGRCKRLAPTVTARRWRVKREDVAELEAAAIADGALRVDGGDWIVTNWAEYQDADPTAAVRQRRKRQKDAAHVTVVTRDKGVTRRVTETETETDGSSSVFTARGNAPGIEESVSEIIRLANRGMADNPLIGDACNPIPIGHGSRQNVSDWLLAGIEKELCGAVVYERAKAWKPDGRRRQITTMAYFDGAVRDAADMDAAKRTDAPEHNGRNGNRPHNRGADAETRGPQKPGKFEHLVEGNAV